MYSDKVPTARPVKGHFVNGQFTENPNGKDFIMFEDVTKESQARNIFKNMHESVYGSSMNRGYNYATNLVHDILLTKPIGLHVMPGNASSLNMTSGYFSTMGMLKEDIISVVNALSKLTIRRLEAPTWTDEDLKDLHPESVYFKLKRYNFGSKDYIPKEYSNHSTVYTLHSLLSERQDIRDEAVNHEIVSGRNGTVLIFWNDGMIEDVCEFVEKDIPICTPLSYGVKVEVLGYRYRGMLTIEEAWRKLKDNINLNNFLIFNNNFSMVDRMYICPVNFSKNDNGCSNYVNNKLYVPVRYSNGFSSKDFFGVNTFR